MALYTTIDYALEHKEYHLDEVVLYMGYGCACDKNRDEFMIYYIEVKNKQQGTFRSICQYLFSKVELFWIAAVSNYTMDDICKRYGFECHGGDYLCTKDNFLKHCSVYATSQ